jgi:fibronectin type 3 domain-containing protein
MTRKRNVVRRAAAAVFALVLALVVVGSVAAARDRTAPTTPTNLRPTSLTQTSVTLAWDPSTDKSGTVTYSVYKDGQAFTVPRGQTTYTIDWLSPGRTYSFYVTASDPSLNQSGRSNTVTVTTPRDTTPPTAPELSGAVKGASQVSLTWTPSTDDISWWTLGYRIFANGAPVTAHVNWYSEHHVVLRHLAPATSYTFTVEANDFNGNTTMSNAVTLTTEATSDVTPPSAPTNVRIVRDQGCGEVWLGWTQSTDDTDPQFAIEYEIYVNGVLSPLAVGAGIDEDFVYATAQGDNTFTVKAVDRAGNTSEASNAFTAVLWPC